jgi:hypothetical protein
MTIDKLEPIIEKLTERIRNLSFPFKDSTIEHEADEAKNEIIELLEQYLELAGQDWEQRNESGNTEEEET